MTYAVVALVVVAIVLAARRARTIWATPTDRPCGLCGAVHGHPVTSVSCEVEMGEFE